MTIDERIQRLTVRDGALAQSVEILRDTVHETFAKVDRHSETLGRLLHSLNTLTGVVNTLAEVANNHEWRITGIEGAPS